MTSKDLTKVNGKDYTSLISSSAKSLYPKDGNKKLTKQYLAKGLAELGKSKIKLTLISSDTDSAEKTAESIQSNIEATLPQVKVEVNSVPFKTLLNRLASHNFQLGLIDCIADFADPISFLDLQTTGASYNYGKWSNKTYDKYVAASKTTGSTSTRFKELAKAEQILLEEQGVTPLYHPVEAWMVKPSVKGVIYNGAGANYSFKYAYLK